MQALGMRAATSQDYNFLYLLHREALRGVIELTWGWDEAWQAAYFREHFDLQGRMILELEGEPIGCLVVHDEMENVNLAYIALLPGHQRKGIGTRFILNVLEDAEARGVPVRLKVLKTNPARELYERLGFTIRKTTDTHHHMQADHGAC